MAGVARRRCVHLLLLLFFCAGAVGEETLRHRQELYIEKSGETTYHTVVDYGPTRWFLAQEASLLPPRQTPSPFSELQPRSGVVHSTGELLEPGEMRVGFASPWLWYGPMTLEGALTAMERPLSQGPFSAAWESRSGSALSVGRETPARLGVGGALGPLSFHHFRTTELIRSAGVLSVGDIREPGGWGELLLSRDQLRSGEELSEEPWLLKEPPLLATEGYHGALRGGFNGGLLHPRLLVALSATRLDPPGFAVVTATTLERRPWGAALSLVGPNYRDGSLSLLAPGVSAALERTPTARRGHALGGSLEARRTGSAGAGEGGEIESAAGVRWKWRPLKRGDLEPRWSLSSELRREERRPEGSATGEIAVTARPELRRRGRRLGEGGRPTQKVSFPLGWSLCFGDAVESGAHTIAVGVEGEWTSGAVTVGGGWQTEREGREPWRHAPRFSAKVSWGGVRRWELGLRLGIGALLCWRELERLKLYDEELEGALFLRVRR